MAAISRDLLDYIGTGVGTLPGRLPSFFTPNNQFYVVQKEVGAPFVDAAGWQLSIGGLVSTSYVLDYAELNALAKEERIVTLECIDNNVGGSLISNARWRRRASARTA
ncbi:MAG: molybdopterin-dependent oxidoreductase [Pyrinomonadaceae bacterium]